MIIIGRCSEEGFEKKLKNRKITGICAGENFLKLCKKYSFASRVTCIYDNYKHGNVLDIDGTKVPVLSMHEMKKTELENSIPIISSIRYAKEIIFQLDQLEACDRVKFYIPEAFVSDEEAFELQSREQQIIPKVIHYCWFGKGEMSKTFLKNIETWKKFCPDYEIRKWDENNYDVKKCNYIKQAYEMGKWAFVSDYARVDIVNSYGGVYLDTDIEILRSWDDLLGYKMFCGFQSESYVNFGVGFGAQKNHEILGSVLEEYNQTDFILQEGTLNMKTCPVYQTDILEKYGLKRNGKSQMLENCMILSPVYFSPLNQYGFGKISDKSFSVHHYAASWLDEDWHSKKKNQVELFKIIASHMED